MLSPDQARRLKEAGLSAYNHNLDTSREFYPEVRQAVRLAIQRLTKRLRRSSQPDRTTKDSLQLTQSEMLVSVSVLAVSWALESRMRIESG
jgi:lipoate synthase